MVYDPVWTNGNEDGRLEASVHSVRLCDAAELAAAVNRRRLLTYQGQQDFSSHLFSGAAVREPTIASAAYPPFDNFRDALIDHVLCPPAGSMGGEPPTPASMQWLWPVQDGDGDKVIVSGFTPPGEGQVGLLGKLNGTGQWTDPAITAGQSRVRAVHFNELRQSVEWLRLGRWVLPIYWAGGIFSVMPDTPWLPGAIANNGTEELRNVGYAVFRDGGSPPRGLAGATVRNTSYAELTADADCTVQLYRCVRAIDFDDSPPTWNEYDPVGDGAWAAAGGAGEGDAVLIGSAALLAGQTGTIGGEGLAFALQSIVDGAEQNFLVRRTDAAYGTAAIAGQLVIEFDLNGPPN